MLLSFGYLVICIDLVFGVRETFTNNGYVVTIDNHTLKSINKTSNASNYLDLSNRQIVNIERKVFNGLDNLISLNLDNNNLSSLHELTLLPLQNLQNLSLVNNTINNLWFHLAGLKNLKYMDAFGNPFIDIPYDSTLNLFRRINKVPFREFNKVAGDMRLNSEYFLTHYGVYICVNENGIVELLTGVVNVTYLRSDAVQNCHNPRLKQITWDRELPMSIMGITGLAKGLFKDQRLSVNTIDLSQNNIPDLTHAMLNELPDTIYDVNLSYNPIKRVKRGIINNKHLTKLAFAACSITEIEDDAFVNTSLTELNLIENKLTNLNFLATLPHNLRNLYLGSNKLVQLIPGTFRNFTNLRILYLHANKLTSVPEGVFDGLENLEIVTLDRNQITDITAESLRGLSSNLGKFSISSNKITKLKSGTFNDKPGYILELRRNKITEIESGTFNLPRLSLLDLSRNLLTTLRNDTFLGIRKLDKLFLTLNNITTFETGALSIMDPNGIVCRDDIPLSNYCLVHRKFF